MAAGNAEQRDAAHTARMRDANPARVSPEQKARVTRAAEDDLTQPLDPTARYACEPNPALGRWHVTEITPELLAARKALS